MPAWLVVITVVGSNLLGFLGIWLLTRRKGVTPKYAELIKEQSVKELREVAEVERRAAVRAKMEQRHLASTLKAINEWYKKEKQRLEDESQQQYEKLIDDPDLLDARLDRMLGISSDGSPEGSNEG